MTIKGIDDSDCEDEYDDEYDNDDKNDQEEKKLIK